MTERFFRMIKPSINSQMADVVIYGASQSSYIHPLAVADFQSGNIIKKSNGFTYNVSTSIIDCDEFRIYVTHRTSDMVIGFTDEPEVKFIILRHPSLSIFSAAVYNNLTYGQWVDNIINEAEDNDIHVEPCTNEFDRSWDTILNK